MTGSAVSYAMGLYWIFCVNNYGAVCVNPQPADAVVKLIEAPEGMELLQPGAVLLWAPKKSQVGEHTVRVSIQPKHGGQAMEKTFRIHVKPLERALCVFAHPDDEFGIVSKMRRMVAGGVDVWAVWTCGGSPVRDTEATNAMTKIGMKKDRLVFQTVGDFSTPAGIDAKVRNIADLLAKHPFDQIYTDGFESGHVQHDMAHFIAVQAARKAKFRGQVYEFGLYNLYGGKAKLFSLVPATMPAIELAMSEEELNAVLELVPMYPSQKHVTGGFMVGLSKEQKMHPRHRPRPNWDYTRQPHKGLLWFELNFFRGRKTFTEQIAGPVKAYRAVHIEPKTEGWEQDRPPADKALSEKVYRDPYGAPGSQTQPTK
jgi:LmbE family N-acetylglucosaminyl deacetylase